MDQNGRYPETQSCLQFLVNGRIEEIQIGLLGGELVQIPLAPDFVVSPRRTAEHTQLFFFRTVQLTINYVIQ